MKPIITVVIAVSVLVLVFFYVGQILKEKRLLVTAPLVATETPILATTSPDLPIVSPPIIPIKPTSTLPITKPPVVQPPINLPPNPPVGNSVVFTKIVIGTIPDADDIKDEEVDFTNLVNYLARQLTKNVEVKAEVVLISGIAEAAKLLRQGKLDLFIDTPFSAALAQKLSGGKFIAVRAKGGVERYRSVIFARHDLGLKGLTDLVNRKMAFENQNSSSNYFFAKAELERLGLTLAPVEGDRAHAGTVGYYFTNQDDLITSDVLDGKADAGARNEVSYIAETPLTKDKLDVLKITSYVFRNLVVASPLLSTPALKVIEDILFNMDKTEEGRRILSRFDRTLYFKPIPTDSPEMAYTFEMLKLVEPEIINSNVAP